jgi:hypothetical protein
MPMMSRRARSFSIPNAPRDGFGLRRCLHTPWKPLRGDTILPHVSMVLYGGGTAAVCPSGNRKCPRAEWRHGHAAKRPALIDGNCWSLTYIRGTLERLSVDGPHRASQGPWQPGLFLGWSLHVSLHRDRASSPPPNIASLQLLQAHPHVSPVTRVPRAWRTGVSCHHHLQPT